MGRGRITGIGGRSVLNIVATVEKQIMMKISGHMYLRRERR
jgi:hypothetical protein